MSAESCEKATDLTPPPWPWSSCIHSYVLARQIRTVWSYEPEATTAESCEKATDKTNKTIPLWPWYPNRLNCHTIVDQVKDDLAFLESCARDVLYLLLSVNR